jgi:hypothetical protein
MPGRVGDHPLDQRPALLFPDRPAADYGPGLGEPRRERVPGPLEYADAEDARATRGPDPPLDPGSRRRAREELGEVALEPTDLRAQRPTGGSLVDADLRPRGDAGRLRRIVL